MPSDGSYPQKQFGAPERVQGYWLKFGKGKAYKHSVTSLLLLANRI